MVSPELLMVVVVVVAVLAVLTASGVRFSRCLVDAPWPVAVEGRASTGWSGPRHGRADVVLSRP